jgi:hypothetical protein
MDRFFSLIYFRLYIPFQDGKRDKKETFFQKSLLHSILLDGLLYVVAVFVVVLFIFIISLS